MKDFLGDNPIVRVNGLSLERLRYALPLASGFPAPGFIVDKERGCLVFMKYDSAPGMTMFPTPLSAERCAEIAFEWVSSQPYPNQPDHDGDNKKGWMIFNNEWGQVDGHGYHSFIAICPTWIMFGK